MFGICAIKIWVWENKNKVWDILEDFSSICSWSFFKYKLAGPKVLTELETIVLFALIEK